MSLTRPSALLVIIRKNIETFGLQWNKRADTTFDTSRDTQGGFLFVLPKDLIIQWQNELSNRIALDNNLTIIVYCEWNKHPLFSRWALLTRIDTGPQGRSIKYTAAQLTSADVVLTTYETLRSDYDQMSWAEDSFNHSHVAPCVTHYPLLQVYWTAAFFDEAHKLCNALTGNAKAANVLRTLFRVLISGTPLQNEYSDVASLAELVGFGFGTSKGFAQVRSSLLYHQLHTEC
jgi:SNF2 family DNA or RNA helicase